MALASGSGLVRLDLSISLLLGLRCGEGGDDVLGRMHRHPVFWIGLIGGTDGFGQEGVAKRKRWPLPDTPVRGRRTAGLKGWA